MLLKIFQKNYPIHFLLTLFYLHSYPFFCSYCHRLDILKHLREYISIYPAPDAILFFYIMNSTTPRMQSYRNWHSLTTTLFFADYNTYRQVITVDVKNDRVICNFWIKIPGLKYASKRFSWKAYLNPGIHIFRILFMLKNHTLISLHQKHYLPPVSPSHRHIDPRSV